MRAAKFRARMWWNRLPAISAAAQVIVRLLMRAWRLADHRMIIGKAPKLKPRQSWNQSGVIFLWVTSNPFLPPPHQLRRLQNSAPNTPKPPSFQVLPTWAYGSPNKCVRSPRLSTQAVPKALPMLRIMVIISRLGPVPPMPMLMTRWKNSAPIWVRCSSALARAKCAPQALLVATLPMVHPLVTCPRLSLPWMPRCICAMARSNAKSSLRISSSLMASKIVKQVNWFGALMCPSPKPIKSFIAQRSANALTKTFRPSWPRFCLRLMAKRSLPPASLMAAWRPRQSVL